MANETKGIIDAPDWSRIPAPVDDGATRHLLGATMAAIPLQATDGRQIGLSALHGRSIVYAYPRTGQPGIDNPPSWDLIPGARGCTPQTCSFRDHFAELKVLGIQHLFGLSTQDPAYQREAAERLHLPFPILSDEHLKLTTSSLRSRPALARTMSICKRRLITRLRSPRSPTATRSASLNTW